MRSRTWIRFLASALVACLLASCGRQVKTISSSPSRVPSPTSDFSPPPVSGPEPSYKVAAFYYPWYGDPKYDQDWSHWTQNGHVPPLDIASDFYPALGPYSSNDPGVVAQHMAWLRQAGVGVIVVSWWGRGSPEERPIPLILQAAARYGIKVAFHIEPYQRRSAEALVSDIKYLYDQYGAAPAFFRSTATSTYSQSSQPKGLFFVWCISSPGACGDQKVEAAYWQAALDAIHALPQGALVIANATNAEAVTAGHFDGLYNYASLHTEKDGGFAWARTLPPGALYVPSVIPGMSARRVGYAESTYVARDGGQTYDDQWTAALGTGVQPFIMTITSFNEWHEGTIIEPPATGKNDGHGYSYADFASLPPDGYLTLTHQWIDKFLKAAVPATAHARIAIKTTSDWTTLNILNGGYWVRPLLISADRAATRAGFESGDHLILTQSRDAANAGQDVQATWDIDLAGLAPGGTLSLQIDRGNIGSTTVTVYNYVGSDPVSIGVFTWAGVTTGRNSHVIELLADKLLSSEP